MTRKQILRIRLAQLERAEWAVQAYDSRDPQLLSEARSVLENLAVYLENLAEGLDRTFTEPDVGRTARILHDYFRLFAEWLRHRSLQFAADGFRFFLQRVVSGSLQVEPTSEPARKALRIFHELSNISNIAPADEWEAALWVLAAEALFLYASTHFEFWFHNLSKFTASVLAFRLGVSEADVWASADEARKDWRYVYREARRGQDLPERHRFRDAEGRLYDVLELLEADLRTEEHPEPLDVPDFTAQDPAEVVPEKLEREKVLRAVERLPELERTILQMWNEGHTDAEIAFALATTPNAVKKRRQRILETLRETPTEL